LTHGGFSTFLNILSHIVTREWGNCLNVQKFEILVCRVKIAIA
jgi:hypothetical protein